MKIKKAINSLEALIKDPSRGLPEDIFLFISKITPMINVDLLIKNKGDHTLLTWRDDGYCPPGWHIPGGIVRYKESTSDRIKAVAAGELGVCIRFKNHPLAINEVMHPSRAIRGHFISFLYKCTLIGRPNKKLRYEKGNPKPGEWTWHSKCPNNLISVHEIYRNFI